MNQYPFINVNYDNFNKEDDERSMLTLEVTLKYDTVFQKSTAAMPRCCIRIGAGRLYYVFDFKTFFRAMDSGEDMPFGQALTYNSQYNYFEKQDMKILNLLRELYEIDHIFMNQLSRGSALTQDGIIEEKWIFLPDTYVERLFKLLVDKSFRLELGFRKYQFECVVDGIHKEERNYNFHMASYENGYELSYDFELFKLSHNFHYALLNQEVVKLSNKTIKSIRPLFSGLLAGSPIAIHKDKQEHFISEVVPYIKRFAKLTLDEELVSSIVEAPLNAEIYLDKKGPYIFATAMFFYDEWKINPFGRDGDEDRPIIFRDHAKEDLITACFSDFVMKPDGLYLYDEDKSYDFLTESLPVLFEQSDVFYSDAFKSIKINTSPTISSRVSYQEKNNFLEFSFDIDGVDKKELHHLLSAIKLKKKYYRLGNGSYIGLLGNSLHDFSEVLEKLSLNYSEMTKDTISLPTYRSFMLNSFANESDQFILKRKSTFRQLVDAIQTPEDLVFDCPEELDHILRDYQKVGYTWLKTLAKYGFGGILADDMGLGKTLQTIAFIISEYKLRQLPTLIVAPTSLVYNWSEEIHKFLPDLDVLIIDGQPVYRQELIKDCKDYPIVITSYPLIRRDVEFYDAVQFNYCIIDEAQHIKNPKSQNAMAVKQIHANGYFALTGTPIENHLTELWSIFDFIMPKLLFSHKKFVDQFELPITRDQDMRALKHLKSMIQPFILRRLKTEVLKELPDKIETKLVSKLNDDQQKLYLAFLEDTKQKISSEIQANTYKKNQMQILSLITRLRQLCCHPSMFIEDYTGGSGKMDQLIELIHESIDSDHKILLFSQYTSMLELIKKQLIKDGIDYSYLDGSVPGRKRKDIIHRFNHEDIPIFLISLKAGGTGLNLTSADLVIHFDPWWNPAVEDQATDRAYRIGQEKNVQVFKMITKGTIEEKIFQIQERKKKLANMVVEAGENFITSLNVDEIKELLDL